MNQMFAIFADGRRVGITVAKSESAALSQARGALTRSTSSKEDSEPDFGSIRVSMLDQRGEPVRSGFVSRLLTTLSEVSNSRFIPETT